MASSEFVNRPDKLYATFGQRGVTPWSGRKLSQLRSNIGLYCAAYLSLKRRGQVHRRETRQDRVEQWRELSIRVRAAFNLQRRLYGSAILVAQDHE